MFLEEEDIEEILKVAELLLPRSESDLRDLVLRRCGGPEILKMADPHSPLDLLYLLQGLKLPWQRLRLSTDTWGARIALPTKEVQVEVFPSASSGLFRTAIYQSDHPDAKLLFELHASWHKAMAAAENYCIREGWI